MKEKADTSKIQSWLCINYGIRDCNQNSGRRFCLEERNGESEICEVKDSALSLKIMTEQIQAQCLKTYHEWCMGFGKLNTQITYSIGGP